MDGLAVLSRSQPIVSTYVADALRFDAGEVSAAYEWHAATYVEQPSLAHLRSAFVAAVRAGRTPKACLVGPFGFGKTASAIGIWRACLTDGFLAVPPVSCKSFTDLAKAVRDWIVFVEPAQAGPIRAAYDRFLEASTEVLAARDEQDFGIPFEQAYASLRDKLERGYLDFEDVSLNLLAFLDQATGLAREAGYAGLVVVIDEFQQLLGNTTKGTLVALRQLVWGLRTRELPLGVLITMDPETERTLADRAGDILHRIKDDGLYLNLQHIYDREFPARLWEQYIDAFGLHGAGRDVIDHATLDSIGQLCEREDLSNGPRMVINALQLAAQRAEAGEAAPYSPLDFVGDLLNGAIRFDGDRSVIPMLLGELLHFPYFQRSPELAKALRLLAAFPRGCSEEMARRYSLLDAWRQLGDELRGDIVTELEEGLTLVELQRVGRPANQLNVLLRRYWMQITDQQLFAEDAPRAFAEVVAPLLFPPKKNDLNGWDGEVHLSVDRDYRGVLEGTSSPRFPLRRVAVRVVSESADVPASDDETDTDFVLTFRLSLDPASTSSATILEGGRHIEVTLALARASAEGLPGGLAWIAHYLSPQPISPALVLSLLRYLAPESVRDPSSRDHARIRDAVARLQTWLLAELLPPSGFKGLDIPVVQAGQAGLHEFLFGLAVNRWPDYKSVAVHQHWRALLADYEKALGNMAPVARVGVSPIRDTKHAIAALLGQARHAGFESRVKQYGELLRLEHWVGDEGAVRFLPHAGELLVAATTRELGMLGRQGAYELLRGRGYSAAETHVLLRLGELRNLVTVDQDVLRTPYAPTAVELLAAVAELESRVARLGGEGGNLPQVIAAVRDDLSVGGDSGEVAWRLEMLSQRVAEDEARLQEATRARFESARARVLEGIAALVPLAHVEISPGDLYAHLAALHARAERDRAQLVRAAERALAGTEPADLEDLALRLRKWREKKVLIQRWGALADQLGKLKQSLLRLDPKEPVLASLWIEVNDTVRDARATLSREGESGLEAVAGLEVGVALAERRFQASGSERTQGFNRAVAKLVSELQDVLALASTPLLPGYETEDDEGSWQRLIAAASTLISRAVALWSLEVDDGRVSRGVDLARAKLRADIRAAARRALSAPWIVTEPQVSLSREASRSLRGLRRRVSAHQGARTLGSVGSRVAEALSPLPPGPIDLSVVLERIAEPGAAERLLEDLIRLHREGSLRLLIDLPTYTRD